MNDLQSQINLVKAQIQQYKDSELFSEAEKERLIAKAKQKLDELEQLNQLLNPPTDANPQ
jgi:hypothetical protein